MSKTAAFLVFLGLAALLGFMGWAVYSMRDAGGWTGGSTALAVLIIGGVVLTGGLTALLMALAFYSSRKGYDDPPVFDPEDR